MLDISKRIHNSKGAYGQYFKISKYRGIKTVGRQWETIATLKESEDYKEALEEASLYRDAFCSGIVPKCYGVTIVKTRNGFQPAIVLQHLGSTTLDEEMEQLGAEREDADKVQHAVKQRLQASGTNHRDLHRNNIMVFNGKYYAIDFTPWHARSSSEVDISSVPTKRIRTVKPLSKWQKVLRKVGIRL